LCNYKTCRKKKIILGFHNKLFDFRGEIKHILDFDHNLSGFGNDLIIFNQNLFSKPQTGHSETMPKTIHIS
jgi:hypothetical protein